MALTLHADIVSVEGSLFSGAVEFIVAPAELGEVGIYPMHAPLLTRLKAGVVRLKIPFQTQEIFIYVTSGILEVQSQGVTVLADIALRDTELAEDMLEATAKKAEQTMKQLVSEREYLRLELELAQTLHQLQGIQRIRHIKRGN